MPVRTVLLLCLAAIGYLILPLDLLPDGFLGPGQIDDAVVLAALAYFLVRYLPRHGGIRWGEPTTADGPVRSAPVEDAFAERFRSKDPYVVLGVPRSASQEDMKTAYRQLLSQYHPDKVAHLSPEFQQLAHERVVAIQQAYTKVEEG